MDEPLSNLDAKLRVSVRTFLKELHRESGATTIFVTHDQAEAMALADRIVVMNGGLVEQVGSTKEIYNHCESLFTAQFMGTPPANILSVDLATEGGRILAKCAPSGLGPGTQEVLDLCAEEAAPALASHAGERVTLAVRPENIRVSADASPANGVRVNMLEPQGAYTILVTTVAGQEWKILTDGDTALSPGQSVGLAFDPMKIMIFESQGGKRLGI